MKIVFIQITKVLVLYFKSFYRVQKTQDEKARFIKGNELKLTQVELFSFLFFKREQYRRIVENHLISCGENQENILLNNVQS